MKGWSLREKFKCYLVPDLTHTQTQTGFFKIYIIFVIVVSITGSTLLFVLCRYFTKLGTRSANELCGLDFT